MKLRFCRNIDPASSGISAADVKSNEDECLYRNIYVKNEVKNFKTRNNSIPSVAEHSQGKSENLAYSKYVFKFRSRQIQQVSTNTNV